MAIDSFFFAQDAIGFVVPNDLPIDYQCRQSCQIVEWYL